MTDDPMHPAQVLEHLRQAARCGAKTRSGRPCRRLPRPSDESRLSRRCSAHACSCRCAPPWVRQILVRHHASGSAVFTRVFVFSSCLIWPASRPVPHEATPCLIWPASRPVPHEAPRSGRVDSGGWCGPEGLNLRTTGGWISFMRKRSLILTKYQTGFLTCLTARTGQCPLLSAVVRCNRRR